MYSATKGLITTLAEALDFEQSLKPKEEQLVDYQTYVPLSIDTKMVPKFNFRDLLLISCPKAVSSSLRDLPA